MESIKSALLYINTALLTQIDQARHDKYSGNDSCFMD